MKIKDLEKGQTLTSSILGQCQVMSITKKYIRLKQLEFNGIICRHFYYSLEDVIS